MIDLSVMTTRFAALAAVSLCATFACRREENGPSGPAGSTSTSTASTPLSSTVVLSPPSASAAPSASSSNDWPQDHAHTAPHGGLVHTAGSGHLEITLAIDGTVTVWLLDGSAKPASAKGAQGTADLESTAGVDTTLTYDAKKDALIGHVQKVDQGLAAVLVVEVTTSDGKKLSSRFDVMPKG